MQYNMSKRKLWSQCTFKKHWFTEWILVFS